MEKIIELNSPMTSAFIFEEDGLFWVHRLVEDDLGGYRAKRRGFRYLWAAKFFLFFKVLYQG